MGKLWFFISCSIRPTCIPYLKFYFMIYNFFFKFYCRILPVEVNFLLKFGRVITYNTS